MQRGLTSVLLSGALSCAPCLFNQQPSLLLLHLPLPLPYYVRFLFHLLVLRKEKKEKKKKRRSVVKGLERADTEIMTLSLL